MQYYPYSSAQFLNDTVFQNYGGSTGSSASLQRNAAYLIAEKKMSEYLDTFLLPTTITGTFPHGLYNRRIELDHTHVNRVSLVRFFDEQEDVYHSITGTANSQASLLDDRRGLVDIHYWTVKCNCNIGIPYPYKVQIVYQAGLPTGTTIQDDMLLALTTAADIYLGEVLGQGNEAPGAVGLKKFANQDYSETRRNMVHTPFGSTPRANFITKLVSHHIHRRYVGL